MRLRTRRLSIASSAGAQADFGLRTSRLIEAHNASRQWLYGGNITVQKMVSILFVCFLALRPKSTAMVIAGRSVHLTTLFPGQA